ncbi:MAG: hypothetical protein QF410_10760 [Planctomycetota bacterium]|nr:hypothetical protein [Deltaproteobacteria bacterium]MDP6540013.1 hypothetical protein [Planctomycetota bacterium]
MTRGLSLLFVPFVAAACAAPVTPQIDPLEPLPRLGAYVPDGLDRSSRDLARGLLGDDDAGVEAALGRLASLDEARQEEGLPPSGLLPYALDARTATVEDSRIRRLADRALLERDDLEPALRERVEQASQDDPLDLAERRLRDLWITRFGRAANTMIESVGRAGVNATLLPFRLAQSVIGIALAEHLEDELTTPERQALAHWKRFVDEHPRAPEAARLLERIRETQLRWIQTQRDRAVSRARSALEARDPLRAAVHAERALRYAPEDADAVELLEAAEQQALAWRADRARAVTASVASVADPARQRALALALLDPADDRLARAAALAREIVEQGPATRFESEARYVLALAAGARGVEGELWDRFESLALEDVATSAMARHARTEWDDPGRNPYRAFGLAIEQARSERVRGTFFGPLKDGARDRELPRWLEYAVEAPIAVGVLAGLPARLLQAPFQETPFEVPAALARRTLERAPAGAHAAEVRAWLVEYESGRGNWVGALGLLEKAPGASPEEITRVRENAGTQAYNASLREKRRDVRIRLLMDAAQQFRGTEGGKQAGEAAAAAIQGLTSQNIRISRGYLEENPRVAGPEGLALRRELLDDDPTNGELHPDGVTLLGERVLEIALLDGRPSTPPQTRRKRISAERLKRLVAQLEEATLHTLRTDRDARVEHDADRDLYFERARLGAISRPDGRPHAESSYAFIGMRERYGLVRSRESILPVQLVLQGSFEDFGLGAFPRIRMPKATPDAFLYKDR